MDRSIVYPGSIPLDTDLLNANRDTMIALGALIAATLGTNPVVDGLVVTPTNPATAAVLVGPGALTQLTSVDYAAFGTLGASALPLVKMGISTGTVALACPAPVLPGQSIAYLIETSFAETAANPVVLPYFNAAMPTQPFLGPAGGGTAQPTRRLQQVVLSARPGTPVAAGSQSAPDPDPGAIGIAVVTISTGQTLIQQGDIAVPPNAPRLRFKLPDLRPGFAQVQAFSVAGSYAFTVPAGVTRAKVTVTGGGGGGGTHASLPGAGGGSGGVAIAWIGPLVPGQTVAITVGAGGASSPSPGAGGQGGTSSFGSSVTATGGQGGNGGTAPGTPAGGGPGQGYGGDVATGGAYGGDAIPAFNRGGDGAGPGGGRGSTGAVNGISALGFGGGGGGGGPGAPGGGGGGGLVVIEY